VSLSRCEIARVDLLFICYVQDLCMCVCVSDKWKASWRLGKPPVWGCHRQTAHSAIHCVECWRTSLCSWFAN